MQPTPEIKGWCPGRLRADAERRRFADPRQGDRLSHLRGAGAEIAAIADNCGNGLIDLSQRAQLQLRGVSEATIAEALRAPRRDRHCSRADADAERVTQFHRLAARRARRRRRSTPTSLAVELAAGAARDAALRALPRNFCFVIDDGGALSLADVEADIRIEADGKRRVAIRHRWRSRSRRGRRAERSRSTLRLRLRAPSWRCATGMRIRAHGACARWSRPPRRRRAGARGGTRLRASKEALDGCASGAYSRRATMRRGRFSPASARPSGRWRAGDLAASPRLATKHGLANCASRPGAPSAVATL